MQLFAILFLSFVIVVFFWVRYFLRIHKDKKSQHEFIMGEIRRLQESVREARSREHREYIERMIREQQQLLIRLMR